MHTTPLRRPTPDPRRFAVPAVLRLGALTLAWLGPAVLAAPLDAAPVARATEFDLTAAPVAWEIQPGLVVEGWGYNGQVPGPELHVREGDLVRIHLHNRLPAPTTIHWHGIDVPLNMDGVPGLSQEPVLPGDDFTYEFAATNPGTRMYHSHVDGNSQLELGLYGGLVVEPRDPEPVKYDREYTYILDEKALDFTPEVALGQAALDTSNAGNVRGGALAYDLFLLNGKAGDAVAPMGVAAGQRIRIRLINLGNLPHSMHLHGHSFTIVATDGNPVPPAARLLKDTVLIGPGERYDLEVQGTNPGVWMFHCHMPNHSDNGMMTALVYDGFTLPTGHMHQGQAPAPSAAEAVPSAPPHHLHDGMGAEAMGDDGDATAVPVLDNRFQPASVTVPVGASVVWKNQGNNLHTATGFDGRWDTGTLGPGQEAAITFDQPGEYRYYCRQHGLTGMVGRVLVEGTATEEAPNSAI